MPCLGWGSNLNVCQAARPAVRKACRAPTGADACLTCSCRLCAGSRDSLGMQLGQDASSSARAAAQLEAVHSGLILQLAACVCCGCRAGLCADPVLQLEAAHATCRTVSSSQHCWSPAGSLQYTESLLCLGAD